MALKLPREEELTGFSIVLNCDYAVARRVNLYFDADPVPVALTTKADRSLQSFELQPRKASKLTLELADFNNEGVTTGIDNIWITAKRSEDFRAKVKPLLNIGGLVKYPMGSGGVLLNQLKINAKEDNPVNLLKKQAIVAALLRNLHATFAGGKVLTTANVKYQPIELDAQCNQFLNKERGWFGGTRDLAHLPVGQVTLCGVQYLIRDFKTSPVPSCVMLAGPGTKGTLPDEVKGLKIDRKADVLFFLHTFNSTNAWRPQKPADPAPVVFKYVVNYSDGQTTEIPITLRDGVDHWISAQPAGLKSAALAWSAKFPGDASRDEAVVYQFQWTNPRPEAEIHCINLQYGKEGSKYGTPALLAITAGTATQ